MTAKTLLTPRRMRDDVADVMRGLIASGDLKPGARLEEVELGRRIGVSRTPIREALITLEAEGWVRSAANKGVSVRPADEAMVCELYPILGALETAALRLTSWSPQAIAELRDLNRRLASETRRAHQFELDSAFHRGLVRGCGNPMLLAMLERHWAQAGRYDGATARGTANRNGSCADHAAICDALEAGDMNQAANLLWRHWEHGAEVVRSWLRANR